MKLFKKHELSQNCLEGSTFLYKKKTRLTSPRVKLYLFHKTKRATGVFGHGLCNKTECKVDTRNKFLNLHWFVIFDMRIPAHVRILRKLGPDFKTEVSTCRSCSAQHTSAGKPKTSSCRQAFFQKTLS